MSDYTSPEWQVRLLIGDSEPGIYDTGEITGFLALTGGNILLAAAHALDTIASTEALLSKKIVTQDLQTDGPAVAAELRAHAKALRAQAAADTAALDDFPAFEIVEAPYGLPGRAPELTERWL